MNARVLSTTVGLAVAAVALSAAGPSVDEAFKAFWNAPTPEAAAKAGDDIIKLKVPFDAAYAQLKAGRVYSPSVARGVVRLSHRVDGRDFNYTLDVPESYTPARKYQVRVQLHGG